MTRFDSPDISGFGMGVDLGAAYQLTENMSVSAAVLDLGLSAGARVILSRSDGTFRL